MKKAMLQYPQYFTEVHRRVVTRLTYTPDSKLRRASPSQLQGLVNKWSKDEAR